MEPILYHLIKSSVLALLFLLTYLCFLRKETYFFSNRIFLLSGILISFLLPFIALTKVVYVEANPIDISNFTTIQPLENEEENGVFSWTSLLWIVYASGVLFFLSSFLLQLRLIGKIKSESILVPEEDITHVQTQKSLSPFSFFKSIFYHPAQFESDELEAVITHEKIHAKQYHSIDVIIMQILCVFLWFNPFIWIYKTLVKQNLEFLADAEASQKISNKKQYQYVMLKHVLNQNQPPIANPFYNSLIKKRIVMLNQNPSERTKMLKLFLILPFLAIFLVGFNTKTVHKTVEHTLAPVETKEGTSFNFLITKTTSAQELDGMKTDLKEKGVDFSYTLVRNTTGNIINIQFDMVGALNDTKYINGNYSNDSEEEIPNLLIKFDEKENEFYIGEEEKETFGVHEANAVIFESKVVNVTIEVDKDSKEEDLKSDAKFLKEKGITLNFKQIKRNSTGEITAIKVNYDNGSSDKGSYSQNKTTPINPFKVVVDFKDESAPSIKIVGESKETSEIVVITDAKRGRNNATGRVFVDEGSEEVKILELKKDGEDQRIILNGKEVTREELKEEGKIEKGFARIIKNSNDKKRNTFIREIEIQEDDGSSERIVFLNKASDSINRKYVIIKETDSIAKNTGNFTFNNDSDTSKVIIKTGDNQEAIGQVRLTSSEDTPLYVIDSKIQEGFELDSLKPDQIESVNVLKGESATKKYGKKGENGVVEITTKKN